MTTVVDVESPSDPWRRDLRRRFVRRSPVRVAFTLWLLIAGTGSGLISNVDVLDRTASTGTQGGAVLLALSSLAFLTLVPSPVQAFGRLLTTSNAVLLLALMATVSMLWAAVPTQSFQGVVRLGIGILAAAVLAYRVPIEATLRGLFLATGSASTISAVLEFAAPERVRLSTGNWHGLYLWNSTAGLVAATATLLAIALPRRLTGPWFMRLVLLSGSVVSVMLAASRTAQLALVVGLGFSAVWRLLRVDRRVGVTALIFQFVAAFMLAIGLRVAFLGAIGKDESLTGRSQIWDRVVDEIAAKPVQGWGFRSYWFSDRARLGVSDPNRIPQTSHNQFLEVGLQLGLFGMVVLAVLSFQSFSGLVRLSGGAVGVGAYVPRVELGAALLGLFGMLMATTISNAFLFQNSIFSVMFLWIYAVVRAGSTASPKRDPSPVSTRRA